MFIYYTLYNLFYPISSSLQSSHRSISFLTFVSSLPYYSLLSSNSLYYIDVSFNSYLLRIMKPKSINFPSRESIRNSLVRSMESDFTP